MGGRRTRRSSNVVLSESRRFCSAALWEVLRTWTTGGAREMGGAVFWGCCAVEPAEVR